MKVVKTSDTSRIFGDDLQVTDTFPVGNYKICFSKMQGFYLEDMDAFKMDEKAYGKHPEKVKKVMRLYGASTRSVGVMLTGLKGMGKSMFGRILSHDMAKEMNLPTFIVNEAYAGIVDFIDSIKQECIIFFDEFEKVFVPGEDKEPQDKLLSLFDGISQTKRLYVITANRVNQVNEFMINRPGRFHYHLEFNHPSADEIKFYLEEKLTPEFYFQIPLVQRFANRVDLNYDALRAIAFELNMGYSFLETIEDLNISADESEATYYDVEFQFDNGQKHETIERINLMQSREEVTFYTANSGDFIRLDFNPLEVNIDDKTNFTLNPGSDNFEVIFGDNNDVFTDESEIKVTKVVFKKRVSSRMQFGKEMDALLV